MRVIGVDLAWAQRNRTGLCLAEAGRVVESAVARTDDAIAAWIESRAPGDVIVAFDAPLIVENETGCRGAERMIGALWGDAQASCYPASRSRPWFVDGGRARRLAGRLGLGVDPMARGGRLAIEVYPHTALVSLFSLGVTLKYKAKRDRRNGMAVTRAPQARAAEFRRLVGYLERLRTARPALDVRSPRWTQLRAELARASSGAALDALEDEVDAYVCAYVAWHFRARLGKPDCAVIGDARSGYVVTPVDPRRRAAMAGVAQRYGVAFA
jgi:predicted RNase H-like nuclease